MTNADNFEIQYNGLTLNKASQYKVFNIAGLVGTPIRTDRSNLTDQTGGIIYNQLYGGRVVGITLGIKENTSDDLFTSFNTLLNAFTKTAEDEDMIIKPWTDNPTANLLKARVIQEPTTALVSREVTHASRIFIQLYCGNPYFQTENEIIYGAIGLATITGFPLSAPLPMPLGSVSGGNFTIDNVGDVSAYARFVFAGELVNPTVTNKTTGESFSYNGTIASGDSVEFKYEDGRLQVTRNGYINDISMFSGTFFDIELGNNVIVLQGNSGAGTLTGYFRNNYKSLQP